MSTSEARVTGNDDQPTAPEGECPDRLKFLPEAWGGKPEPKPLPSFERAVAGGTVEDKWEELSEMIHDVGDVVLKYKEIRRAMDIDAEQTWRANPLVRAKLATECKALHIAAKLEAKRRELDREQVDSAIWKEAEDSLQREKDEGRRDARITIEATKARMVELRPDEYRASQLAKVKSDGLIDFYGQLASNLAATIRGGGT